MFRQSLNLNSRQSWVYEGNGNCTTNDNQNPADGDPGVFRDESHDMENPPAPQTQPANSISITSCRAVPDDAPTDGAADSRAVDSRAAVTADDGRPVGQVSEFQVWSS
ncbi:carbohydrate-binding protein [Streptomyces sp. NPDC001714]|uniref:hypothetical protein n=1 Tax=Streptomyces sp. NPDC001714 TaxID=3364603 RepID=UPI0036AE9403